MSELVVIEKAELKKLIDESVSIGIKTAFVELQTSSSLNQSDLSKPVKGDSNMAKILGISMSTFYKLKKDKIFPFFQSGKTVIYDRQQVLAALAAHQVQPRKWVRIDKSKLQG